MATDFNQSPALDFRSPEGLRLTPQGDVSFTRIDRSVTETRLGTVSSSIPGTSKRNFLLDSVESGGFPAPSDSKSVVTCPVGLGNKNRFAGEDQQFSYQSPGD
jgi:hypothetical protein